MTTLKVRHATPQLTFDVIKHTLARLIQSTNLITGGGTWSRSQINTSPCKCVENNNIDIIKFGIREVLMFFLNKCLAKAYNSMGVEFNLYKIRKSIIFKHESRYKTLMYIWSLLTKRLQSKYEMYR